jgi:CitMHS family citrate-Mg2+:H+ or citrate-Ca2+:H+ symporter
MLSLLGFLMISTFMYLIMSKRMFAMTALILIPILFALIGGFRAEIGEMMLDGVKKIAPTGVMLIFAIMYFGIMTDAGLFDPIVGKILKVVGGDPLKVVIGTAILALSVSLDGDGTTTYIIVVAAMLPLYKRLKMNPLVLTATAFLASAVMNILPWGGPTARVLSALHLDSSQVFTPLIPAMVVAAGWVIFVAYILGKRERARLGISTITEDAHALVAEANHEDLSLRRPKLLWLNAMLTLALLVALFLDLMPLPVLFMTAFALGMLINYPRLGEQRGRLNAHAGNAMIVAGMVFAAGVFTGILAGTKMVDAMSQTIVTLIPNSLGPHLPILTGITSAPFTFFMSNDAYYFGILPLVTKAAAQFGVSTEAMGRASLLGQSVHLLSPLVPSTYLLAGLAGVDFGDHQRFTLKWACGTVVVMLVVCLLLGVVPL